MKLYLISGLGGYSKVLSKIQFPEKLEVVYLDWKTPNSNESLEEYTQRFIKEIDVNEEFMLLGYSFGGIIAQEIHKKIPAKKIVILASFRLEKEKKTYLKILQKIPLHALVPEFVYKSSIVLRILLHKLGLKNQISDNYFERTNAKYLKWSINQFIKWKNTVFDDNIIQINADNDLFLPKNKSLAQIIIPNSTHLFVITHHKIISEYLKKYLT